MVAVGQLDDRVGAMRHFNRFYTKRIGVLAEGMVNSSFPLPEARVLYELGTRSGPPAREVAEALGIDPAYLSRLLRGLVDRGLVSRTPDPDDGRQSRVWLTDTGREAFAVLDQGSQDEFAAVLSELPKSEQVRLLDAMRTIEEILGDRPEPKVPYIIRPHRPGDFGYLIQRHAAVYAQEFGWDGTFEGVVAEIAAGFIGKFDPTRDASWIAEREGKFVGSIFLERATDTLAKLRLLFVEPEARGLGIGSRLVTECVDQARRFGYRRITLWTYDALVAARRLYDAAGFRQVSAERHMAFGREMTSQHLDLDL